MSSEELAIGIDLGTTNSCVAVFRNGEVEVIPNEYEKRTTPSMVTITKDGTRYVGTEAARQQYKHLENTIYESKRLIGRKYNEQCIQDRMKHWHFKVIEAEEGNPKISIPQDNQPVKCFHPEEISGMIIEKMKLIAENYLKCSITKAVITVPAYFNDNQRQATIDAAKLADLEVLKIMNEPTAAAFAYIFQNRLTGKPINTLVFDLGGGTFDVSIIHTNGKNFTVIAVDGDPDLGGADFDMLIYNQIVNIIQKQSNKKIDTKAQAARITKQCIRVKEELSTALSAHFDIVYLIEDFDFRHTFTRVDFEKLIRFLVRKMIVTVKNTLAEAKMSVNDIDNIVLVGGSTRIPAIANSLKEFFKKDVSHAINPDEAVACGAAYQAAMLTNIKNSIVTNVAVKDVTPFSLGIEAEYNQMNVIIERNTGLPISVTREYTTIEDNQTALRLKVFQGEERFTACNNTQLGYFDFIGIPPAPAKKAKIDVTFNINTNGVLHVSATEKFTKQTKDIEIIINTGRMTHTDFMRIDEENKKYNNKLSLLKRTENEKNDILKFCFNAKRTVENINTIEKGEKDKFISEIDVLISYLENLKIDENVLQTLLAKKDKFKQKYDSLVTQL